MAESSSKKESSVESYKPDGGAPKRIPRRSSTLGSTLLRDYRIHLDPLNTNDVTTMPEDIRSLTPTAKTGNPLQEVLKVPPSSPPRSVPSPKAFLGAGMKPTASISPHRSILRTLASRSSQESLRQERGSHEGPNPPPSFAARFLHTPCFFHQRFEDAVNVDRVLEEVAADDDGNMSTSRLMQTATSVREISKQLQRRPIKRAVRNIMIVTKARDNDLVYLTRELTQWLLSKPRYSSELGVCVYVDAKLRTSKRFDAPGLLASNPRFEPMLRYWTPDVCITSPERFDLVLTLGGDGTVLYTSWLFQRIVPPILSFSLGSLGFLTNFAFGDYKPTLDRIMEGAGMRVNMRMRFTCTVYRAQPRHNRTYSKTSNSSNISSARQSISSASAPASISTSSTAPTASSSTTSTPPSMTSSPKSLTPESTFEVLNELVLDRGPSPYVSNLELYGDTHLLTIIQADGVIISTPTGSTAYSLSAGGPLTHPSIPGILLTPICPHTLSFRPMVLSDTLLLRLVVPKHSRGGAYASFDGKGRVELRRGDEVRVEVGRYPFPTVVGEGGTGGEWFESVRRALRWNTRGAVQGGFGSRVNAGEMEELGEEEEQRLGDNGQQEEDGLERQEEQWDIDADPIDERDLIGPLEAGGGADTCEVGPVGGERDSPQKGKDPGCALD